MTKYKDDQFLPQESRKSWEQKEERNSRPEFVPGYNSKHLPLGDEAYYKNYRKYKILTKYNFKSDISHDQPSHRI